MKFPSIDEFKLPYGWFILALAVGSPLGFVGIGFLMYFGPILLIGFLIAILVSSNAKIRAILWGLLAGVSCGVYVSAKYYLPSHV